MVEPRRGRKREANVDLPSRSFLRERGTKNDERGSEFIVPQVHSEWRRRQLRGCEPKVSSVPVYGSVRDVCRVSSSFDDPLDAALGRIVLKPRRSREYREVARGYKDTDSANSRPPELK
ncbi:hypothetical protein KM043_006445 [Ampulex compressa]|nr:hypothetical protein KM043_006445 [Ampulex compressa]